MLLCCGAEQLGERFILGFIILLGLIAEPGETKNEMLSRAVFWARLAETPIEKTTFTIAASGTLFTRSYKGSFKLKKDTLLLWIQNSPGLQDANVEDISAHLKKYAINRRGAYIGSYHRL